MHIHFFTFDFIILFIVLFGLFLLPVVQMTITSMVDQKRKRGDSRFWENMYGASRRERLHSRSVYPSEVRDYTAQPPKK